jgi:hypothetical protein
MKVTPYDNPYEQKAKIMSGINDSGYIKSDGYDYSQGLKVGPNGDYLAYSKKTGGWEGVSGDKVKQVADVSADLYGNTTAGKYETQKLLRDKYGFGDAAYNFDYNTIKGDERFK